MQFSVDVWFSESFPVGAAPDDWRRFRVKAPCAVEAELVACQITASHAGRTPVRSVVIDWEE
jgi:hypothetical protein